MTLRDNPVKSNVAGGGRALGAMIFEFFTPGMPQICANAGAEFALFDMEHTGLGFETLKTQCALCRGLEFRRCVLTRRAAESALRKRPS